MIADCSVRLGKHFSGRDQSEVSARIASYYVHPQYDAKKVILGYDIALLRLVASVKETKHIKPICLPFGLPELQQNSTCYSAGWGFTHPSKLIFCTTFRYITHTLFIKTFI